LAKLQEKDPLRAKLKQFSSKADGLRSKMVATKEGGTVTGEERIREHVGELYGAVTQYEGRPTDYQVARADALNRELEDVTSDFNKLTAGELPAINNSLQEQKPEPITIPNEAEWLKAHANWAEALMRISALSEAN
jgi:hypothetical protein